MMRKIYIYSIIILFFSSTTALPFTQHLCKMMDTDESVECSMHNPSPQQMKHHNCNSASEVKLIIKKSFSDCCELQIVDNKITDEFLSVDKNLIKENTYTIILLDIDNLFNKINPSKVSYYKIHNTSPPSSEEDLYIHNSILII